MSPWARFRQYFALGLLAVAPLAITAWILMQAYLLVSRTLRPLLARIPGLTETFPSVALTLIAFACFVVLIALIGVFARNVVGRAFFNLVAGALERIPLVKSIFTSIRQLAEAFFPDQRSAFKEVVLFEYPRPGSYSIGFLTASGEPDGLSSVFLPTTPNPTTGFLLILPPAEVIPTRLTVEEGIRLIMTGGAVMTRAQSRLLRSRADALAPARPQEAP